MSRIIGIAGKMGSGKDTAAGVLRRWGFRRRAFADALKDEVDAWLQSGHEPPEGCPVTHDEIKDLDPYQKPTQPSMRTLLQWWGTDYRRAQDKDYWVKKLFYTLDPLADYVISDVRFANEAQMIRELGGQVWLIARDAEASPGILGHASETLDFTSDLTIPNEGTLDDFCRIVQAIAAVAIAPLRVEELNLTPPGVIRDTMSICGKVR